MSSTTAETPAKAARVAVYEGMFLFPQSAGSDLAATVAHLEEILTRHGAEMISLVKWDERRLAYDIRGNKRGLYFLSYFRCPTDRLAAIERSCNLSETLLRSMVVRADHVQPELMENEEGRRRLADEMALRGREAEAAAGSRGDEPGEPAESGDES
jgi:small subunit ribosomal protein S6